MTATEFVLAKVGEVWGEPHAPETWRWVTHIWPEAIVCKSFGVTYENVISDREWMNWIATSGAKVVFAPFAKG